MLYFHCHIVISSSLKHAVFIISYVALYHFHPKITISTFHIFVRQNCTHLTIFVRFYLLYFDQSVYKKAKPALCFARIAKAILGDVTLHNSSFLLIKKEFVILSFQRHITNSLSLTYLSFPYLIISHNHILLIMSMV